MTEQYGIIVGFGPLLSFQAAKKYVKEGFNLAVVARSKDKLEKLAKDLGDNVTPIVGDGSELEKLIPKLRKYVDKAGQLDLLHYNLGIGLNKLPLELTNDDLDKVHQLTSYSPLNLIQEFHKNLESSTGSFLVTGGGLAIHPHAEHAAFSIGNAAKRNLVYTLYQQLREKIHVATVTINITVKTDETAKNIADQFWKLHTQKQQDWQPEIVYSE